MAFAGPFALGSHSLDKALLSRQERLWRGLENGSMVVVSTR